MKRRLGTVNRFPRPSFCRNSVFKFLRLLCSLHHNSPANVELGEQVGAGQNKQVHTQSGIYGRSLNLIKRSFVLRNSRKSVVTRGTVGSRRDRAKHPFRNVVTARTSLRLNHRACGACTGVTRRARASPRGAFLTCSLQQRIRWRRV